MTTATETANPKYIQPLHEVRDGAKLRRLAESMETDGWVGRPVLALDTGNGLQALTGSHRIAAAIEAGLDQIPVYVVDIRGHVTDADGSCVVCGEDCWIAQALDARDDDDRLAAVEQSGDDGAISLMQIEVKRGAHA